MGYNSEACKFGEEIYKKYGNTENNFESFGFVFCL